MFLEHPAEQLIIGEAVAFQDHMHGGFCVDQIFVNERKSVFILIFQKRNPHLFLKKTTEIAGLQVSDTGNLVQRYGTLIIFGNVIQNKVQPVKIFFLLA